MWAAPPWHPHGLKLNEKGKGRKASRGPTLIFLSDCRSSLTNGLRSSTTILCHSFPTAMAYSPLFSKFVNPHRSFLPFFLKLHLSSIFATVGRKVTNVTGVMTNLNRLTGGTWPLSLWYYVAVGIPPRCSTEPTAEWA